MCKALELCRSTYYETLQQLERINIYEKELYEDDVISAFHGSRRNYGTRKIQQHLRKEGKTISRRRIGRIMIRHGLVSKYTVAQYKPQKKDPVNNDETGNVLDRKFNDTDLYEVIVSDLTYVRIGKKWHYICIFIDLYNREIISYNVGAKKDAALVYSTFINANINLEKVQLFHTDRGSEFKNEMIEDLLETYGINRSLSKKGCPYDNAVAEATYKIFKTEFINGMIFETLEQLDLELFDYINWYNRQRLHGSLGYKTPIEMRKRNYI